MPDPLPGQPEPGTPAWWLLRLLRRLQDEVPAMRRWERYVEGDQPLAFASAKFQEAFGDRFPAFTSNFCDLVVEGVAERLEVQGFRFGSRDADEDAWALWQENDLDAASQLAHTEALVKGRAYALVEPAEDGPVITIEDACEAIVEGDPRRPRVRRAGLKRWVDDEGHLIVYVYLPEALFKYRSRQLWTPDHERWWHAPNPWEDGYEWRLWSAAGFEPLEVPGEEWPVPNRLGVVPLVELPNRPRLRRAGRSEVAAIRSNQDAVNKYRADALIASEFAAFPQRYLLNFEPERDPDTGRPREPFRAAIDRLWTVPPPDPDNPDAPEPKIGSLPSASLEPYSRMIELEVGHISSISGMPYHYLLGTPQTVPPSGESLKSSEARLVRKVGRAQVHLGEGWEEVLRTAFLVTDDPRSKVRTAETIWRDSETRNEGVRTDAIVKLHSQGIIDDELAWEMAGLSPEQVARLRERRAAAQPGAGEGDEEPPSTPLEVPPAPTGPRMGGPGALAGV